MEYWVGYCLLDKAAVRLMTFTRLLEWVTVQVRLDKCLGLKSTLATKLLSQISAITLTLKAAYANASYIPMNICHRMITMLPNRK